MGPPADKAPGQCTWQVAGLQPAEGQTALRNPRAQRRAGREAACPWLPRPPVARCSERCTWLPLPRKLPRTLLLTRSMSVPVFPQYWHIVALHLSQLAYCLENAADLLAHAKLSHCSFDLESD
jgi:hypothetical protein